MCASNAVHATFHEAHRLFVELGVMARAEQVAREIGPRARRKRAVENQDG
jgi:hypothetical protein